MVYKRDHLKTSDWICVGEGPIGPRRWSYGCGYCMIRLAAAFESGEMADVDPVHKQQIHESLLSELTALDIVP